MARRGIVQVAQDAVTNTAGATAKAATGTVLQAVKGARRLVRGKTATRKTKRKKAKKVRRERKSPQRGAKRAVQSGRRTTRRKK